MHKRFGDADKNKNGRINYSEALNFVSTGKMADFGAKLKDSQRKAVHKNIFEAEDKEGKSSLAGD